MRKDLCNRAIVAPEGGLEAVKDKTRGREMSLLVSGAPRKPRAVPSSTRLAGAEFRLGGVGAAARACVSPPTAASPRITRPTGPFRNHDPLGNDRPHGPPPHPRPTGNTAWAAPARAKSLVDTPIRPPMVDIPRQRATESGTAQPSVAGQVAGQSTPRRSPEAPGRVQKTRSRPRGSW